MKCPVCIQEGKKSTLRERGGTSTLMSCQPFYDEDGKRHHHDSNTSTYGYSCSNGHSFSVSRTGSCWCGWNKDRLPQVQVGHGDRLGSFTNITDPEVLKAMTAGDGSEFSILSGGKARLRLMAEDFDVSKPLSEQPTIKAPVAWTEQTVFEALRTHFVEGAVALLPQVASETGAAARRIADCIAMQLWPSRGLTLECVEIKVHRNDLIREYQQPEKGDLIGRFCDKFWIAAPPGIVKQSDFDDGTFPKTWGCLEVSVHEPGTLGLDEDNRYSRWLTPHVYKVKVRKKAEENKDALPPSRGFLASVMRNLQAFESPEAVVERKLSMVKHKAEQQAWDSAQKEIAKARAERDEFRRRIYQFENITGLRTGVFDQIWDEAQLRKTHEKQKHLIQIAHSVEHSFEQARDLAKWLENRGKEMQTLSETLTKLAVPVQKDGDMTSAATSTTVDVSAILAAEEKQRFETDQALGKEVYDFLYLAVAEECSKKRVLGGERCGKCLVCQAKVLEEKLRIRHVQLGWKLDPCKSCKGTGVQKTKSTMK